MCEDNKMINKFKTEELGIGFDFDVEFEENQKARRPPRGGRG